MIENRKITIIPSRIPLEELGYTKTYQYALTRDLEQIENLVNEGYELEWSKNERWLRINNKIFNVSKEVYENRKYFKENGIDIFNL